MDAANVSAEVVDCSSSDTDVQFTPPDSDDEVAKQTGTDIWNGVRCHDLAVNILHRDTGDATAGRHTDVEMSDAPRPQTPSSGLVGAPSKPLKVESVGTAPVKPAETAIQDAHASSQQRYPLDIMPSIDAARSPTGHSIHKRGFQGGYGGLVRQLYSSPISQDQLAEEIKSIYRGLVMVEAKCTSIDAAQAADPLSELGAEQWQALIALHKTLLYEHHDFLMATQHPSASPSLQALATKYCIPARMWKHGIETFLEILRHRRPESQEFMLTFLCLAYQMMALLFETVPSFLDTWIECLGDLARYHMAIEEEKEAHSRWGSISSRWYTIAVNRHPDVGRLSHHLAILERPSLRKLAYYAKALTSVTPFPAAKGSLSTLCTQLLAEDFTKANTEGQLATVHASFFEDADNNVQSKASRALRLYGQLPTMKIFEIGVSCAIANVGQVLSFGNPTNALWRLFVQAEGGSALEAEMSASKSTAPAIKNALPDTHVPCKMRTIFCNAIANAIFRDCGRDSHHLLPAAHVSLAWLYCVLSLPSRLEVKPEVNPLIAFLSPETISWGRICRFLNSLIRNHPKLLDSAQTSDFPAADRPLPEDYDLRGLKWTQGYLPSGLFPEDIVPEEFRVETFSTRKARVQRVLWLAFKFAAHAVYLQYDAQGRSFTAPVFGPTAQTNPSLVAGLVPLPLWTWSNNTQAAAEGTTNTPRAQAGATAVASHDRRASTEHTRRVPPKRRGLRRSDMVVASEPDMLRE